MTTWAIRTEQERQSVLKAVENRAMPFTVQITKGVPCSLEQKKLQHKWHKEAEEQGDQTAEEYRGYCKLHFGVAIMKYESPEWAELYDRIIKPLPYEDKLKMMMEPMDFPVTRCMSSKGKHEFLNKMHDYYISQGFIITEPEDRGRE
jgi:hypothetical protein